MPSAIDGFTFVRDSGLFEKLLSNGWLVPFEETDPSTLGDLTVEPSLVLEHPRLPFISYPYEWPFNTLKSAALHHLKVHLLALDHGVTMSDASAYNIQFRGGAPVFIDHLSFVPLEDGGFWKGHRQFCEQFLNPLLLRAYLGIPHNAWYRGNLEGIPTDHLSRLMPFRRKLSLNVLMHVTLPARFQRNFSDTGSVREINAAKTAKLPLSTLRRMLEKLAAWIERLDPPEGKTEWSDYADQNSYDDGAAAMKRDYIKSFVADTKPGMVWDLGCNTGDYALAALDAGAGYVVGFDVDHGALEKGFERVKRENLDFLPLYFDAANPAPNQGWAEAERSGMLERAPADGVLALALVHHLAISSNIPVPRITEWLTRIGASGVVEFVPKSDPMVKRLLQLREDIFPEYTADRFLEALTARAEILDVAKVPNSDRTLIRFRTNSNVHTEATGT